MNADAFSDLALALICALVFFRRIRDMPGLAIPALLVGVAACLGVLRFSGVAVALGTLGRAWSGPANLMSHLGSWATAFFAAGTSVVVNNLPAASLLSARAPKHPFSLLIGLNLGPNLFVTGSLAWLLWLRTARSAGAQPSIAKASRIGVVAVPLSMAAALTLLTLTGSN